MRKGVNAVALVALSTAFAPGVAGAQEDAPPADAPPVAIHAPVHRPAHASPKKPVGSATAVLPGFETLADGSTRLFVELSQPVEYVAKTAGRSLIYVLKGTTVAKRNNYNPLVTVDFNTAVSSARLAPHGKDLWFSIALRAKADPVVTMDSTTDGGAVLHVAFAKGDYLPATPTKGDPETSMPPSSADEAAPSAAGADDPPPPKHRHHSHP